MIYFVDATLSRLPSSLYTMAFFWLGGVKKERPEYKVYLERLLSSISGFLNQFFGTSTYIYSIVS